MAVVGNPEIYQEVAEKNSKDIKLVKSIGDFVFEELIRNLNSPIEISYTLPKLGTWHIRHNIFKNNYYRVHFDLRESWFVLAEKIMLYRDLKKKKRKKRKENAAKQECTKSSEDKPAEY